MFGKKSYLKTLESRKQALLAESEVNRIELLKDWDALKIETNRVKKHFRNVAPSLPQLRSWQPPRHFSGDARKLRKPGKIMLMRTPHGSTPR